MPDPHAETDRYERNPWDEEHQEIEAGLLQQNMTAEEAALRLNRIIRKVRGGQHDSRARMVQSVEALSVRLDQQEDINATNTGLLTKIDRTLTDLNSGLSGGNGALGMFDRVRDLEKDRDTNRSEHTALKREIAKWAGIAIGVSSVLGAAIGVVGIVIK